jgi:predicted dehydrogenase
VEVTAISDSDEYKVLHVAKRHKIPRTYTDPAEMLTKEKLHGVLVLTATNLHFPILKYALKKQIPIFVERPPVLNLNELNQLLEMLSDYKGFIQVGVNQRFDPDFILLKEFLEKKEIGEIIYANFGWLQALKARTKSDWFFEKSIAGGGVVMDLGFILIDLLLWMLSGYKVKSVRAKISNIKLKKNVEDFASIYINFENGPSATIEASWDNVHPEDKFFLKLYGSEGYASYPKLKFFKEIHSRLINLTPEVSSRSKSNHRITYVNEINYFINALRNKIKPVATIQEYRKVYQVIQAAYQSAERDAEVLL